MDMGGINGLVCSETFFFFFSVSGNGTICKCCLDFLQLHSSVLEDSGPRI